MSGSAWLATLVVAVTLAGGVAADAQAQALSVDADLAKRGKSLFTNKGCIACHTIGKGRSAGPDLAGVTERRPLDWLREFLKNTDQMLDTDSVAQALLKENDNIRMPNLRLKDTEVEALLHYLAQQSPKTGGDAAQP